MYILIFVALFSCKSNTTAQEKKDVKTEKSKVKNTKDEKPKIEKPGFGDPRDNEITRIETEDAKPLIETNTVHLTGSVLGLFKNKKICGKPFMATTTIKVERVTGSGSGIVNLIPEGQEITFGFLKDHAKDFDALQQKFAKDNVISLVVKESLCSDTSETVFEIIRFGIK